MSTVDVMLKEISAKIDNRMDRLEDLQRRDHDQIVVLVTKAESTEKRLDGLDTKFDNMQNGFDEMKQTIPLIKEKLETACKEVEVLKTLKEEKTKTFGERLWSVAFWCLTCVFGGIGAWAWVKITGKAEP